MTTQADEPGNDHDGDCPAVTGDGPDWAPHTCRCTYLALTEDGPDIPMNGSFGSGAY